MASLPHPPKHIIRTGFLHSRYISEISQCTSIPRHIPYVSQDGIQIVKCTVRAAPQMETTARKHQDTEAAPFLLPPTLGCSVKLDQTTTINWSCIPSSETSTSLSTQGNSNLHKAPHICALQPRTAARGTLQALWGQLQVNFLLMPKIKKPTKKKSLFQRLFFIFKFVERNKIIF